MVAIFGWIMPEPFAMPRIVMSWPAILICAEAALERVSVVGMAWAKAWAEASVAARAASRLGSLLMILSAGSGTPMMPVDDGNTSFGRNPKARAASLHTSSHAVFPAGPVAQLALPELMRMARMRPLELLRLARPTSTGAATTRFLVKTAAAVAPSQASASVRSGRPLALMPAMAVANVKPRGTRISSDAQRTGRNVWVMLRGSRADGRRS